MQATPTVWCMCRVQAVCRRSLYFVLCTHSLLDCCTFTVTVKGYPTSPRQTLHLKLNFSVLCRSFRVAGRTLEVVAGVLRGKVELVLQKVLYLLAQVPRTYTYFTMSHMYGGPNSLLSTAFGTSTCNRFCPG